MISTFKYFLKQLWGVGFSKLCGANLTVVGLSLAQFQFKNGHGQLVGHNSGSHTYFPWWTRPVKKRRICLVLLKSLIWLVVPQDSSSWWGIEENSKHFQLKRKKKLKSYLYSTIYWLFLWPIMISRSKIFFNHWRFMVPTFAASNFFFFVGKW